MKNIQERKLALISQIHQLEREIDKLKQQDYRESQLRTCTCLSEYVCLYVFDSKLQ